MSNTKKQREIEELQLIIKELQFANSELEIDISVYRQEIEEKGNIIINLNLTIQDLETKLENINKISQK